MGPAKLAEMVQKSRPMWGREDNVHLWKQEGIQMTEVLVFHAQEFGFGLTGLATGLVQSNKPFYLNGFK